MTKKNIKKVLYVVLPILFLLIIIIYPFVTFKIYERKIYNGIEEYYEFNNDRLPSNGDINHIPLKELYRTSFLKKDFYIPYTKKVCSIDKSFINTKNTKNVYKHYIYLDCGYLKSKTDHEGPEIVLKGKDKITLNRYDKFIDPGISSVVDNSDGKININKVKIDSNVNTNEIGTYYITYSVLDSFNNKTTIKREVNVIEKLINTVKKGTNNTGIYKGIDVNNYIYFSGILFRIVDITNNNIKIVTANEISSVNYDGIDKWLNYFYEHISDSSKKYLVKNKYCNDIIDTDDINTNVQCKTKTKDRYVYLLSNKELNQSRNEEGDSYLFFRNINWIANSSSKTHSWASKYSFIPYDGGTQFYRFSKEYNFAVSPVLIIKGDSLVKSGDGSFNNPFKLNDINKPKLNEKLNKRYSGEYVTYSGRLWMIVDTLDDGTTKVISENAIELNDKSLISYEIDKTGAKIYNPMQKGNIGYSINKMTSDTINEKYFVSHEITVPIYKENAKYGEEIETKKYKVKFSAPNMYEMFSGPQNHNGEGYWLINSSKQEYRKYVITNAGTVMYQLLPDYFETYIRPVAYFSKDIKIKSGDGTRNNPYKLIK